MNQSVDIRPADGGYLLEARQWVPRALGDVFAFFADPANLERITPAFLHFNLRRRSTPEVREGTMLTYTLRLHGLPVVWRSRIQDWQPPHRFVDVQTLGPYARWHHTHEFSADRGGTLLTDTVRYRLRFHFLAATPLLAWVHRDVRRIFEYRQAVIDTLLASPLGN